MASLVPRLADLKDAERDLIWGVFHATGDAVAALAGLTTEDFQGLAGAEILEMAQSLQNMPADRLPGALLERLSTMDAQMARMPALGGEYD